MANDAAVAFQIGRDSLHRLQSYCGETARGSIRPNFSEHPVGEITRWIVKWMTPFLMASTSSISVQSLVKIVQRAPAVAAKMSCLSLCFLSVTLPVEAQCVRGVPGFEQALRCSLWADFDKVLSDF